MKKHSWWCGVWNFEYRDKNGNLIEAWSQENALADEGEKNILSSIFRTEDVPTEFHVRLYNDTPVETDTLADLVGEPVGNGYSPKVLERDSTDFPTLELNSGDWQVKSKAVVFTASGGTISTVTYAILAASIDVSGDDELLYAYVALSTPRTLANGESLTVTFTIKLQ